MDLVPGHHKVTAHCPMCPMQGMYIVYVTDR